VTAPSPADEPVEVLDEDGTVVAVVPRARMRRENLRHRAVFVVVQSTDGRVLVHRRSDAKDLWPGWWDVGVGGVVGVGEGWDAAARRELAEEVGVTDAVLEPWGDEGRYEDDQVKVVGRAYRVVHDGPFTFADGEVVDACFVDLAELRARLTRDRFLPDGMALLGPLLTL
jgi:isopentenyldiphosphate isomerase